MEQMLAAAREEDQDETASRAESGLWGPGEQAEEIDDEGTAGAADGDDDFLETLGAPVGQKRKSAAAKQKANKRGRDSSGT